MIECLYKQVFLSFEQIHEAIASFHPLSKNHGHAIDVNDVFRTNERWKKLQESVKLISVNDSFGLSPMRQDLKGRQIPPIELWCSIVQEIKVTTTAISTYKDFFHLRNILQFFFKI